MSVLQIICNREIIQFQVNKFITMSIYSGFATRSLQQTYDQYVSDLLFVMQKRILKFYQNVQADEDKFWNIFSHLYQQIAHLEKCKYLEPKSSVFVNEMYEFLKAKKEQRQQDLNQDLKRFERSMAIRANNQQGQAKLIQTEVNNFIRRSSFSFGKIKRQLDPTKLGGVSLSNSKIAQSANNSFDLKINNEIKVPNPEEKHSFKRERVFSSKGVRNAKCFHQDFGQKNHQGAKINIADTNSPSQIVKDYLQKTNKNYLRGYRKRRIKEQFGQSFKATSPSSKNIIKEKKSLGK